MTEKEIQSNDLFFVFLQRAGVISKKDKNDFNSELRVYLFHHYGC